jgi:branched-chain amino acid aminotransferase
MVKNGVVATPAVSGAFLNGVTRQRTLKLLREAGVPVVERALSFKDFMEADEIFTSGNASKILPCTRIQDRELQPGPFARHAKALYWEFAQKGKSTPLA